MIKSNRLMVLIWCTMFVNESAIVAWGAGESSIGVDKKQRTNFYGTLTTYQGSVVEVDNISVDGKSRQIPVYEKPDINKITNVDNVDAYADGDDQNLVEQRTKKKMAQAKKSKRRGEIVLNTDPLQSTITFIDLNEIRQISVPDHRHRWIYENEKTHLKQNFIEIIITPKDQTDKEEHYLVETKRVIYCDGIRKSGPEEKKVPMGALDKLEIKGYCTRDESGKCPVEPKVLPDHKESIESLPEKNPIAAE